MSVESPVLDEVFPAETITLSTGRMVTVKPWGVYAAIHEVPVLLGRIFAKLMPLQNLVVAEPDWLEKNLPAALTAAAQEVAELVRHSTGIPEEWLGRESSLTAEDFVRLAEAVMSVNRGFFAGLVNLRSSIASAGAASRGSGSPSRSSGPDSG